VTLTGWERASADGTTVIHRCHFPGAAGDTAVLRFDGLATLCRVVLNGQELGRTANMHRAHRFEVVLEADNVLEVLVDPVQTALEGRRPRPRWKTALVNDQKLRFVRTALLGHLTAWGPDAPPNGPWRAVHLEPVQPAWRVTAGATWLRVQGAGGAVLDLLGRTWRLATDDERLELPDAPRWWPHTLGHPTRVPWTLRLGERVERGHVGFRHVGLVDEQLRVNGRPIFCRGACLVTLDDAGVQDTLATARDAGLNMVRVVGTTSYASEAFYEACDRLGLLVWQDLPFANLDYPFDDPDFVAEVDAELEDALTRLASHPSLALICGGSEVDQQAAMLGVPPQPAPLLAEACALQAPGVPYVPNSPTGGPLPFSTRTGVTHYWGVGAYRRDLSDVRRAAVRFTSECLGFSNVPSAGATPRVPPHHPDWKAGVPRDAGAGWDFEDVRDHYLRALFGVDPVALRSADLPRYLACSRVVTGELMLRAFAEWRRADSPCQGALVWWLRDLRPGAGWGVLDDQGVPKPAWWYLRRAWADRAVLLTDEGLDGVELHVHNERDEALAGRVVLSTWRRGRRVFAGERDVAIDPRGTLTLSGDQLLGSFQDLACAYRFGPPKHDAVVAQLFVNEALVHQDVLFPGGLDLAVLDDVALSGEVVVDGDDRLVTLRSDKLLQAVTVEARGWSADDDHLHLVPGTDRQLRFTGSGRFKARFTALNTEQALTLRG